MRGPRIPGDGAPRSRGPEKAAGEHEVTLALASSPRSAVGALEVHFQGSDAAILHAGNSHYSGKVPRMWRNLGPEPTIVTHIVSSGLHHSTPLTIQPRTGAAARCRSDQEANGNEAQADWVHTAVQRPVTASTRMVAYWSQSIAACRFARALSRSA